MARRAIVCDQLGIRAAFLCLNAALIGREVSPAQEIHVEDLVAAALCCYGYGLQDFMTCHLYDSDVFRGDAMCGKGRRKYRYTGRLFLMLSIVIPIAYYGDIRLAGSYIMIFSGNMGITS